MNNTLTIEQIDHYIRDIICELYDAKYNRHITITPLPIIGYEIKLPLWNDERPFVVSIEADGKKFLKYLKLAIQESNLGSAQYYKVKLENPQDDNIINIYNGKK